MLVELYGVYLARFQFLGSNAYKVRPVVAVGRPVGPHKVVLVIPLSSLTVGKDIDVAIQAWQASGLAKPTIARVHRLTAMLGGDILEWIGRLDTQDADRLKQAIRQALAL